MRGASAAVVLLCAGCTSARIAGGVQVAPGNEPRGATVTSLRVGRCEDARGERTRGPDSRIMVLETSDSSFVLVERRPGYDSMVVVDPWIEGETRVFQLALKRSGSAPYLREYRTPVSGNGKGRLVIVARVRSWGDGPGKFRASYTRAALTCTLVPV